MAAAPSGAPRLPRRVLVLGSSVSTGEGATEQGRGWAALLQAELRKAPWGFEHWSRGKGGTHVEYWQDEGALLAERVADFAVVILSLSLGNEGLARQESAADIERVARRYADGLRRIARRLRQAMHPQARLVLGGPYPHGDYKAGHLRAIQEVRQELLTWPEVDHVIDFLKPCVHDGRGHWHRGAWRDPGHPNDAGHRQMFQCVELHGLLGPFSEGGDGILEPLLGSGEVDPAHRARVDGLKLATFRHEGCSRPGWRSWLRGQPAAGWFEEDESGLVWRSFNGVPDRRRASRSSTSRWGPSTCGVAP
ncbi:unnamed protein product [Prorocentrum cordatum]|uniref:SGNH hydrolase-type esterase domain-containing protein n=1 Tax=Prorocentrum cordatum TaxID=2364126 RepID=A0ABN9UNH8_9DINO|nr:unnamed protein product [Polarella glacialis]